VSEPSGIRRALSLPTWKERLKPKEVQIRSPGMKQNKGSFVVRFVPEVSVCTTSSPPHQSSDLRTPRPNQKNRSRMMHSTPHNAFPGSQVPEIHTFEKHSRCDGAMKTSVLTNNPPSCCWASTFQRNHPRKLSGKIGSSVNECANNHSASRDTSESRIANPFRNLAQALSLCGSLIEGRCNNRRQ